MAWRVCDWCYSTLTIRNSDKKQELRVFVVNIVVNFVDEVDDNVDDEVGLRALTRLGRRAIRVTAETQSRIEAAASAPLRLRGRMEVAFEWGIVVERIGILGGTFNPIHIGHLLIAQRALESAGLDRVIFIPCHTPAHKGGGALAAPEDRLAMVRLAIAGNPAFEASDLEIERGGVSYAVDTILAFRERFPDREPHFIIGMDALRELHLWHRVNDLLALCPFLVLGRPGVAHPMSPAEISLPPPWPERLLANVVSGRLCEVSSREIRQRVAEGRSIRYLVPSAVEQFILDRGLYR